MLPDSNQRSLSFVLDSSHYLDAVQQLTCTVHLTVKQLSCTVHLTVQQLFYTVHLTEPQLICTQYLAVQQLICTKFQAVGKLMSCTMGPPGLQWGVCCDQYIECPGLWLVFEEVNWSPLQLQHFVFHFDLLPIWINESNAAFFNNLDIISNNWICRYYFTKEKFKFTTKVTSIL